jgi:hypothetical protein
MRAKYVDYGDGRRGVRFYCPGCEESHLVPIDGPTKWSFNGNLELPTITPSLDIRIGHYADGNTKECYCNFHQRFPDAEPLEPNLKCKQCHCIVSNGKILYVKGTTHALLDKQVDLPEI